MEVDSVECCFAECNVDRHSCLINIPASDGGTSTPTRVYIIYTLVVSFIIPVTLISIFYTMLVIELQRRRMPTHHPGGVATQRRLTAAAAAGGRKMRARKITWLVTTVVVVYVVCWLPYWTFQVVHVQRLCYRVLKQTIRLYNRHLNYYR